MNEIWKTTTMSTKYEVSNLGNVRHKKKKINLKPWLDRAGYNCVSLYLDVKPKKKYPAKVHRLVAGAFIDTNDITQHVDHINRIRTDNKVSNLRWATPIENQQNKIKTVGIIKHILELDRCGYTPNEILKMIE